MLSINSISKGIVIDHIQAGHGIQIFEYLNLREADYTVALIMNAQSDKMGRKDMIKIENEIDWKINLSLPEVVEGVIKCKNPRCITSVERNIPHKFVLVDKEKGKYKCAYCDHVYGE